MAISIQRNTLNIQPGVQAPTVVHLSTADYGNIIEFYLYDGSAVFDPDGCVVSVHGVRRDGAGFGPYPVATEENSNHVTFPVRSEMTSVSGPVVAELTIAKDSAVVGTANFGMIIEEAAFPNGPTYENSVSVYQQILNYVQSSVSAEASARQTADSALQTQIDNIIAPSGEAPSAAEVENARIGADGTTYTTLGNAIRGQVTWLQDSIEEQTGELWDTIDYCRSWGGVNYLSLEGSVANKSINSSGEIVDAPSNAASTENYLPISASTACIISSDGTETTALVVAFYNANKEFISRVTNVSRFTTPANTAYIRVTSKSTGWDSDKMQINAGTEVLPYAPYYDLNTNHMGIDMDDLSDDMASISDSLSVTKIMPIPVEFGVGFASQTGIINQATGFRYKKFKVENHRKPYYYSGKMLGSAGFPMAVFYDANGQYLSNNGVLSTSTATQYNNYEVFAPEDAKYVTFSAANDFFVEQYRAVNHGLPASTENPIGHNPLPSFDTDIVQIIFYGQSLSNGSDSLFITDPLVDNCDMLGTSLAVPSDALRPLQATSGTEQPIISAINCLHDLVVKNTGKNPLYVGGSYGEGGRSIAQLMSASRQTQIKSQYGYSYDIDSSGTYTTFTNALTAGAAVANQYGKSISCPVIVFLQGERDYYSDEELIEASASNPHAYACGGNKDRYKLMMRWLKDDMQAAVMEAYGQTEKPLFCIYQCSGQFIGNHAMSIDMAQMEFAEERDDVVLLPAPYFTPNYENGHLSTNGYRWYGEYIAQAIFQALIQRSKYRPLICSGVMVDGNKIRVKVTGGVLPLKIDTYTAEQVSGYGFAVWADGSRAVVNGVIVYGDEIIISTTSDLTSASSVEVSYCGMEVGGTGNIRDNALYKSKYTYWDDSSDTGAGGNLSIVYRPLNKYGNSLIGGYYPMYNWLAPFYIAL